MGPKRNGEIPEEMDFASALAMATSTSMTELEKVTHLMHSLLVTVQRNRETRSQLETTASSILETEWEKVKLLEKCTSADISEIYEQLNMEEQFRVQDNEEQSPDEDDAVSDSGTINAKNIDELTREKIDLQVELQNLEEVGEKSDALMDRYKMALSYILVLVDGYATGYVQALQELERSLQMRIEQEQATYDDLVTSNTELLQNLHHLHESLGLANTALKEATDDV